MITLERHKVDVGEFRNDRGSYILDISEHNFDIYIASDIERKCSELIANNSLKKLVINLENVLYMSTVGIGTLLEIYHICNNKEVEFEVINVNKFIYELLSKTHVSKVLTVLTK